MVASPYSAIHAQSPTAPEHVDVSSSRRQAPSTDQSRTQLAGAMQAPLLYALYQSIHDDVPWQGFAQELRRVLGARNVGITLHHMKQAGQDSYVMAGVENDAIDWLMVEQEYRSDFMADDPLSLDRMQPGQVVRVNSHGMHFVAKLGLTDCVRLCVAEPLGMRCWIDIVRSDLQVPKFAQEQLDVLQTLLPHLENALCLFARLQRQEAERYVYESMLDHLGLGCVLLDGSGHVLHMNPIVAKLMVHTSSIKVSERRLKVKDRAVQRQLDQAIDKVILARALGSADINGEVIRLGNPQEELIGILVQPAPVRLYYQGQEAPSAIVYFSEIHSTVSLQKPTHARDVQRICSLFDLTKQEATLSLLLAFGSSIAEAAETMKIGESAARNYSKKIYSKMSISGQADLVRVMLRSLSFLR